MAGNTTGFSGIAPETRGSVTCDGSASRSKKIALEQERQDCL